MSRNKLIVSFSCPDCESKYQYEFDCDCSVDSLTEQIDDARACCPICSYTYMDIDAVSIADEVTQYDLVTDVATYRR